MMDFLMKNVLSTDDGTWWALKNWEYSRGGYHPFASYLHSEGTAWIFSLCKYLHSTWIQIKMRKPISVFEKKNVKYR